MIVFDTDVITLLTYGQTERLRERVQAAGEVEQLAVTVVTYMEVLGPRYDAVYKAANAAEMAQATRGFRASKAVLDAFLVLHHNDDSYRRFEELMKQRKGRKRKKDRADMMIASIALANDALLVTRNVRDYQGVNNLRVENWAD